MNSDRLLCVASRCLLAGLVGFLAGCGGGESANPQDGDDDRPAIGDPSTSHLDKQRGETPETGPMANSDSTPSTPSSVKLTGNWRRFSQACGATTEPLNSVWMNDDQTEGWAIGDGGVVLHCVEGKWQADEAASRLTSEPLNTLAMSTDGSQGWAAGGTSFAVFLRLEGGTWKLHDNAGHGRVMTVRQIALSNDGKQGWATDSLGRLAKLDDGGWKLVSDEFPDKAIRQLQLNAAGTEGWATGEKGVVQHLVDGKWVVGEQASGLTENEFNALWINEDATSGWAVASSYKKSDMFLIENGAWKANPPGAFQSDDSDDVICTLAMSQDGSSGWAGTADGGLLRYHEGEWEKTIAGGELTNLSLISIALSPDAAIGCAADRSGNLFRLSDGTWRQDDRLPQPITRNDLNAIWMNEDGTAGWVAGNKVLLRYAEGSWSAVDVAGDFQDIWLNADQSDGWAVGNYGRMLHYEGGEWLPVAAPSSVIIETLWIQEDGSAGWAPAERSTIFRLSQGEWQTDAQAGEVIDRIPGDIWMSADGATGWIVGDEMILRYDGGKWSKDQAASELASHMHGIAMRGDGSEGWAVGDYATLLHLKNGKWQKHEAGISADWLTAVKMNADLTAGFALGKRGEILRYENGKWQPSPATKQVSATLTDLWLNADASEGWAIGQHGEIWRYSTP